jgi:thioredoxin 1
MESDKVVMLDFWATWCGPCVALGPTVEAIATDYEGKAIVGKVNVDENPDVSVKFGIRNIPTILFIKNGEVVDKQVGNVPRSVLEQTLQKHM